MKKFVIVVFACIFTSLSANAKTLKGKVIGEISTYYPKETIKIEVTKSVMIKNTEFKKGYVVTGTMTDVKSPDKGQNEASFVFTITDYTDTDGTTHKASEELKTTYTPKSFLDKGFFFLRFFIPYLILFYRLLVLFPFSPKLYKIFMFFILFWSLGVWGKAPIT